MIHIITIKKITKTLDVHTLDCFIRKSNSRTTLSVHQKMI